MVLRLLKITCNKKKLLQKICCTTAKINLRERSDYYGVLKKSPLERIVCSGGPMKGPQHKIPKRNVNGSCEGKSTHFLSGVSKLSLQCDRNRLQITFGLYFALRNGSLVCQIIPQLVHEGFAANAVSRHSGVSLKSRHYSLQLHGVKSFLARRQSLGSQPSMLSEVPFICF